MVVLSLTTRSCACFLWCVPTRIRGDCVSSATFWFPDSFCSPAILSPFSANINPVANNVVTMALVILSYSFLLQGCNCHSWMHVLHLLPYPQFGMRQSCCDT